MVAVVHCATQEAKHVFRFVRFIFRSSRDSERECKTNEGGFESLLLDLASATVAQKTKEPDESRLDSLVREPTLRRIEASQPVRVRNLKRRLRRTFFFYLQTHPVQS